MEHYGNIKLVVGEYEWPERIPFRPNEKIHQNFVEEKIVSLSLSSELLFPIFF